MSARFNKILFYALAGSSRNDGENSFPYHSCGSPALPRSNYFLQVEDPRAPSLAGCYGDTYTTLF